ncbi:zinc ribbon domain-containing protein [Firmicutes bacterium OM07-11]|nr:zinc ribbon domain-containing protein [Firmicutes bacterium OM07-11]
MICKNCSAQIPDGSKFCTVCGHKIVVEPFVAPKPQQPPQTEPT